MREPKNRKKWNIMIEFVPFESEEAKKDAYRNWVRTLLKGKKAELESRKTLREQQKNFGGGYVS